MRRFYSCKEKVIPVARWLSEGCPLEGDNCYECEYFVKSGTLGGQVWVDCKYDEREENENAPE